MAESQLPSSSVPTRQQVKDTVPSGGHISTPVALLMIMVAVGFDGIQFIATFFHVIPLLGTAAALVITWFAGFVAQVVFMLWFALLHVDGSSKAKAFAIRMLIHMSTFVVELIPVINAIPAITLGVIAIIIVSRAQEALGNLADVSDEDKAAFLRQQAPLTQFAAGRYAHTRGGIDSAMGPVGNAAETQAQKESGRSRTQHQDDYRQKQIDKADQMDLTQPQPNLNRPKPKPWF
ncbi:MAG: hypothetical protein AAB440_03480 [Patescibacteria group bacterium]